MKNDEWRKWKELLSVYTRINFSSASFFCFLSLNFFIWLPSTVYTNLFLLLTLLSLLSSFLFFFLFLINSLQYVSSHNSKVWPLNVILCIHLLCTQRRRNIRNEKKNVLCLDCFILLSKQVLTSITVN